MNDQLIQRVVARARLKRALHSCPPELRKLLKEEFPPGDSVWGGYMVKRFLEAKLPDALVEAAEDSANYVVKRKTVPDRKRILELIEKADDEARDRGKVRIEDSFPVVVTGTVQYPLTKMVRAMRIYLKDAFSTVQGKLSDMLRNPNFEKVWEWAMGQVRWEKLELGLEEIDIESMFQEDSLLWWKFQWEDLAYLKVPRQTIKPTIDRIHFQFEAGFDVHMKCHHDQDDSPF